MLINTQQVEIILAQQGISKATLAKRCGLSRQNISTVIRRGTCEPKTAGKVAAGLGVQVNDIIKSAGS